MSTQHDDFDEEETMLEKIKSDIISILIPRLIKKYPSYKNFLMMILNITSIQLENLLLVAHMEILDLQEEKL